METSTMMVVLSNQTTTTGGIVSQEKSIGDVAWLRALRYTLYAIIFMISLPGNLIVCAIITRRRKMKTITNFLILNLAISDVLYTMYVPLDIVVSESNAWPFAEFFCKLFYPLMTLSICVSAFTLMVLALSRYWAVVFPLRRQVSVSQIKIAVVVSWLMSVVEVLPYAVSLEVTSSKQCEESAWPSDQSRKIYTIVLFLLQFVIPLTAITFAYTMVGFELKKGNRRTENQYRENTRNEESKKIIRMLVFVTVTFALCNLPTSIMWMINDFGSTEISGFDDVIFFFNILDFGNAAVNPCIYLTCNEDFKREFRRYVTIFKRKVFSSRTSFPHSDDQVEHQTEAECSRNCTSTMLLKTTETCT